MIAGFNTDIEYNGVVYHVQTEDKGAPARVLMSLVYDKGTILASKRAGYDDGIDEKELADRLTRQHKLICAAVNSGRINELVEMTRKSSKYAAAPQAEAAPAVETIAPAPIEAPPVPMVETVVALPPAVDAPPVINVPVPPPIPLSSGPITADAPPVINVPVPPPSRPITFEDLPVIDAIEIIEDLEILPDDAVAVVSEFSGQDRPKNTKLSVEVLGESKYKGGDRKTVNIMVCRGTDRKVIGGAQIMIKILGSTFRPVIFHARSDANGLAKVHLQVPHFDAGRAALLVRAMSDGEEIELRRIVTPG